MANFLRSAYQSPTITRPSIAGRTVMTNYGPYTMQGASEGGYPVQQSIRQPQMTAVPIPNEEVYRPQNLPQVRVQDVRNSSMNNGNPELQGGMAMVNVNGQPLRVPNALLQQMMYADRVNQGRSNSVREFFQGNNPNPSVYQFQDNSGYENSLNKLLANNPFLMANGAVNPFVRAQDNANNAYGQLQQAQVRMGAPMKENRNPVGQLMGQNEMGARQNDLNNAQNAFDQAGNDLNQYGSRGRRQLAAENARESLMEAQKLRYTPTYSNLPIRETIR